MSASAIKDLHLPLVHFHSYFFRSLFSQAIFVISDFFFLYL